MTLLSHGSDHERHQRFERSWWGDCGNTFGEECKQLSYANRMGLHGTQIDGKGPFFRLGGRSVADLGGGPVSLLLKTVDAGRRLVVDPCDYPMWVRDRYAACGIRFEQKRAEDFRPRTGFDEVWIYNVLQHVIDPELIIQRARNAAKFIRIFEWIDIPPHEGHPHELNASTLDRWLSGHGSVEQMNENGCVGRAYYGSFIGNR